MTFASVPNSLALIPDGNRRWARQHNFSMLEGYNIGVKKFIDFGEWCKDYGVKNLTVWALSAENLKRSNAELNALFNIYRKVSKDKSLMDRLDANKVRIKVIGNFSALPKDLYSSLKSVEQRTEGNSGVVINMLLGYGGREDMVFAAKRLADMSSRGYTINEDTFTQALQSYQVPNIDFIIRTSGEQRLSGFMPWQTGYSELYFSKKLWPDFSRRDLYAALADYNKRERRFGR